ncbi:TPA: hypothetical protein ACH3X2_008092 [Trebouxia sp. C0005]
MRSSLEDFTFNNRLGTGTYGTVWQAVRKQDGRTYAVKELDLRYLQKQEQAECIREVKVLSDLDSPYIIKFFDSFLDQGKLYIVTEFASKGSVHELINKFKGQVPEDICWKMLIQTTLGLQHMHQKNILHRDIKSLNLLLDTNRQVKIADLGIATVLSSPKGFAKTLVGTPYYLSPELCEGKPYNEKSDVWALGVVLYECCTGTYPFDAQSQASLLLKIMAGHYAAIVGYSADLRSLLKRCLTQSPDRRPNTDRILNLPVIRAKAKQLGIDLPEPSNASGSHAHSSSAVQAPKYHPVCKGSVLTRRPSSAGVSSHAPHCFAAPDEEDTQAVRRRASESTLGTASLPGCQSGDAMPQQLPVKLPPAWRSKIAMLKSRKYGQQGNAGASVAQGAVQPAEEGTDAASAAVDQSGL